MKQTAVEWLIDWIGKNQYFVGNDLLKAFKQAKEMEKERLMDAYGQGVADEAGEIIDATKDAEHYYNRTYKS